MSAILLSNYVADMEALAKARREERELIKKTVKEGRHAMSGKSCTLTPAYGRDYKNMDRIRKAFYSDADFILHDLQSPWHGKLVNRSQLIEAGYREATIRYDKLRKTHVLPVVDSPYERK